LKQVSVMRYRAAIYWNILVQIADSISNAKIIDCESFMVSVHALVLCAN
jgi:hypothetical protein